MALAEPAEEPQYKELLQLLEEEMAGVQEEFKYAEKVNEQKAAIERDACLAPAGEEWRMLLRREEALDRSIDRKIKLLLTLRKEAERSPAGLEPTAHSPSESSAHTPFESSALSLGERVSRSGAFTSRSVTGEGSLPGEEQPAARPDKKPRDVAATRRHEEIDERPGYIDENNGVRQRSSRPGMRAKGGSWRCRPPRCLRHKHFQSRISVDMSHL